MSDRTIQDLQMLQAMPLKLKISMTQTRIREWVREYGEEGVYVSFSGGKDSTVLLHLVRELYPDVPAVFVDTGLEYPEIRDFVKTFDNVTWLKPKLTFRQTIEKYGYPFISKEVAECVYGARKYLTRIAEESTVLTDRQTDRQTDRASMLTDLINYADLVSSQNQTKGGRDNKYRKLRGTGMYAKMLDHQRVQLLMGILTTKGKVKAGEAPSEKDRSAYSCYRYQFFLKAPFEIGQGCCNVMKKAPAKKYTRETGRKPMLAQLASESKLRTQNWLHYGCNAFDAKKPASNPMSFWTEQDVLLYLYERKLPIASVYGEIVKDTEIDGQLDLEDLGIFDLGRPILKTTGAQRTGCMFCGFGCHLEKSPGRFELMKKTHPKQYEYIMKPWEEGGLGYKEIIDWINENGDMDIKY